MKNNWNSYRIRKAYLAISIVSVPVLGVTGLVVASAFNYEDPDRLGGIAATVGFALAALAAVFLAAWQCPRCERPFFCRVWWSNIFAMKCVHCGLEKYDPNHKS